MFASGGRTRVNRACKFKAAKTRNTPKPQLTAKTFKVGFTISQSRGHNVGLLKILKK
jgi:hypothetical protein